MKIIKYIKELFIKPEPLTWEDFTTPIKMDDKDVYTFGEGIFDWYRDSK